MRRNRRYQQTVYSLQADTLLHLQQHQLYLGSMGVMHSQGGFEFEQLASAFCLHVVTSGSGIMESDGTPHLVEAGEMFLFWPGQHIYYHDEMERPWQYTYFWLQGEHPERALRQAGFAPDALHRPWPGNEEFAPFLARAPQIFGRGDYSPLYPMRIAWELLDYCTEIQATPGPQRHHVAIHHTCRGLLESQYMNDISIEELARELGVSRVTLFRRFRNAYGCSPKEYLNQVRLEQAARLLREGRLAIKEVASTCGYRDVCYFSRCFRREYGTAPGRWRELCH